MCTCKFFIQVTVIGDGRGQTVTMAGDKLYSTDALVKVGEEVPMPAPIKDTRKALSEKVFRSVVEWSKAHSMEENCGCILVQYLLCTLALVQLYSALA